MYTGLAGLIDRFFQRLGSVPFLAPLKQGDLMMDMAASVYGPKMSDHPLDVHEFQKLMLQFENLESKVESSGGSLTTRRIPLVGTHASKMVVHNNNEKLQQFADSMFSSTVPHPIQNTAMSSFDAKDWAKSYVDDVDVLMGRTNSTMQEFSFPVTPPTIEWFPRMLRDGLLPNLVRFEGDRVGQRQVELHFPISVLNPPIEGRAFDFQFPEYEGSTSPQ